MTADGQMVVGVHVRSAVKNTRRQQLQSKTHNTDDYRHYYYDYYHYHYYDYYYHY